MAGCNRLQNLPRQTTVPNRRPIQAVSAIASAPQNVTRVVARTISAPPACAPTAPRTARKQSDASETTGTSHAENDTMTITSGIAAPTAKVAVEVNAACTGRAGHLSGQPRLHPAADIDARQLSKFELRALRQRNPDGSPPVALPFSRRGDVLLNARHLSGRGLRRVVRV